MSVSTPAPSAARAQNCPPALAGLACLLGILAAAPSPAQDSTAVAAMADTTRPVTFLKEVLVTGARYPRAYYESPQALSFVSRLRLAEQAPSALGDVLAGLPGADNSKDSPWEQRPVLRGLGGQRVLVVVDGMPMNSARGNGPHPSLVDPSQVERVEVVRGPSSVAYGSDALGGAIHIITRDAGLAGPDGLRGAATVSGSSADGQAGGLLELRPRIGRLSAFVSTGMRHAGEVRTANGTLENSEYQAYNALANLRYEVNPRTALRLGWQLYRGDEIGIPGLSFAFPGASQAFDFSFYNRDHVHLTLDRALAGSWLGAARAKVYWQQERRNFFSEQRLDWYMFQSFGLRPAGPPMSANDTSSAVTLQDRYLDLETYGAQAQLFSAAGRRHRFTFGVDAARDLTGGDNVRFRTYYDAQGMPVPGPGGSSATAVRVTASLPQGRFDNYGAYAQTEWSLHPRWTLHAGGRFTQYRYRTDAGVAAPASGAPGSTPTLFPAYARDDGALSGSAGIVFTPHRELHITANVASGFREPNAQDLFFDGPASVGYVLGNPDLDPERSVSYDLGLRWGTGSLALAGNVFWSTYQGLIDAVAQPFTVNGQPAYRYTNIAQARILGYEAEAEWRVAPGWSARGSLSASIGDITSAAAIQQLYGVSQDQAPLPGVPPLSGAFAVRFGDRGGRFWVEPATRFAWRTSRLPLPTPNVPQFTEFKAEWIVADLSAGARLPWGQTLVAGVRNLTDTPYRRALASVDDPGVNFFGQLTTDF